MTTTAQIRIYGKTYAVKRTSKQADLDEIAKYVDAKMQELSYGAKASTIDLAILAALNIAQELMDLKKEFKAEHEFVETKTQAMVERLTEVLNDK